MNLQKTKGVNSFEILIFGSSISNIQKQYSTLSEKVKITMVID